MFLLPHCTLSEVLTVIWPLIVMACFCIQHSIDKPQGHVKMTYWVKCSLQTEQEMHQRIHTNTQTCRACTKWKQTALKINHLKYLTYWPRKQPQHNLMFAQAEDTTWSHDIIGTGGLFLIMKSTVYLIVCITGKRTEVTCKQSMSINYLSLIKSCSEWLNQVFAVKCSSEGRLVINIKGYCIPTKSHSTIHKALFIYTTHMHWHTE